VKTALGAENTVRWEQGETGLEAALLERERGCELAVIETDIHAVDLFDWAPRFPVCLIFGNEKDGVSRTLADICDTHVRIPMLGAKHSLNVATAGGVVLYELLRKYRG
jgi:tRNA G18 (ribose-2'-O)-methylase SpoU